MGAVAMVDINDGLTEAGAKRQAAKIRRFWKRRGIQVETRVELTAGKDEKHPVWVVRSNLSLQG